jgi:hypothetical protein
MLLFLLRNPITRFANYSRRLCKHSTDKREQKLPVWPHLLPDVPNQNAPEDVIGGVLVISRNGTRRDEVVAAQF